MNANYSIGDKVTLYAGTKIGMGTLRKNVEATVVRIEKNDNGIPFYAVKWVDEKTGKTRYTFIAS